MREVSSGRGNGQKVTDAGCNKFVRINEQAEAVEVKRTGNSCREMLLMLHRLLPTLFAARYQLHSGHCDV